MTKRSLRIGEIAARAGVGVDTVRYYERRAILPPATRRSSGYRAFQPETVERILFVKELQALGFSLDEVVALLTLVDMDTATCASARGLAVATLDRIEGKIRALSATRDRLVALLGACNEGTCNQLTDVTPRIRLPLAPRGSDASLPGGSRSAMLASRAR